MGNPGQYFHRDSYAEIGPGAMTFSDTDTSSLHSRVGVQFGWRMDVGQVIVVPELTVGWEHEFLDDDSNVTASFAAGGSSFDITTASPDSDSVYFGGGVTARLNDSTTLFANYEGSASSNGQIHGITGGVRFWF